MTALPELLPDRPGGLFRGEWLRKIGSRNVEGAVAKADAMKTVEMRDGRPAWNLASVGSKKSAQQGDHFSVVFGGHAHVYRLSNGALLARIHDRVCKVSCCHPDHHKPGDPLLSLMVDNIPDRECCHAVHDQPVDPHDRVAGLEQGMKRGGELCGVGRNVNSCAFCEAGGKPVAHQIHIDPELFGVTGQLHL